VKIKKIHIFGQKWPISNFIFAFSALNIKELFKNSGRKKVWQKVAIGKFATFLTPFQANSTKICLQVKSSHWTKTRRNINKFWLFKNQNYSTFGRLICKW
jgi:hypothetical protein